MCVTAFNSLVMWCKFVCVSVCENLAWSPFAIMRRKVMRFSSTFFLRGDVLNVLFQFMPSFFTGLPSVFPLTRHGQWGFRQGPDRRKQIYKQVSAFCCVTARFLVLTPFSQTWNSFLFSFLVAGAFFSHSSTHTTFITKEKPSSWDTERLAG